jgi:hypothetical protein
VEVRDDAVVRGDSRTPGHPGNFPGYPGKFPGCPGNLFSRPPVSDTRSQVSDARPAVSDMRPLVSDTRLSGLGICALGRAGRMPLPSPHHPAGQCRARVCSCYREVYAVWLRVRSGHTARPPILKYSEARTAYRYGLVSDARLPVSDTWPLMPLAATMG